MITSKVLYFTAGPVPTAKELAEINRLMVTRPSKVFVRNGATAADTLYGTAIEPCDFCAGPAIPTAYNAKTVITVPGSLAADQFKVLPATLSLDASNLDVTQLSANAVTIDADTGLAIVTNLAADAAVVWTNSDDTKATVGGDGLVTAVAAGSTTVTATYTPGTQVTGGVIEADDDIYTKSGHGFNTGDALKLVSLSGGSGLTAGTTYYFIKLSTSTGKLASSFANAVAGTAVDVTVDATSVVLVAAPQTSTCVVTVVA